MKTFGQISVQIAMLTIIVMGVLEIAPIFNLVKFGTVMLTLFVIIVLADRTLSGKYEQTEKPLTWNTVAFYLLAVGVLVITGHFVLATLWIAIGLIVKTVRGYGERKQ